eukprot:TRINITY_DN4458_c1_g1_i1.p1 TRINITY_DN4458_c1_g1~~TRINITY_DN4458_c1_g1_i1.p1  ORF type:complete len:758 (-),score=219.97 TRINITY_DN4458_c1_g1_i1:105-2264(-)
MLSVMNMNAHSFMSEGEGWVTKKKKLNVVGEEEQKQPNNLNNVNNASTPIVTLPERKVFALANNPPPVSVLTQDYDDSFNPNISRDELEDLPLRYRLQRTNPDKKVPPLFSRPTNTNNNNTFNNTNNNEFETHNVQKFRTNIAQTSRSRPTPPSRTKIEYRKQPKEIGPVSERQLRAALTQELKKRESGENEEGGIDENDDIVEYDSASEEEEKIEKRQFMKVFNFSSASKPETNLLSEDRANQITFNTRNYHSSDEIDDTKEEEEERDKRFLLNLITPSRAKKPSSPPQKISSQISNPIAVSPSLTSTEKPLPSSSVRKKLFSDMASFTDVSKRKRDEEDIEAFEEEEPRTQLTFSRPLPKKEEEDFEPHFKIVKQEFESIDDADSDQEEKIQLTPYNNNHNNNNINNNNNNNSDSEKNEKKHFNRNKFVLSSLIVPKDEIEDHSLDEENHILQNDINHLNNININNNNDNNNSTQYDTPAHDTQSKRSNWLNSIAPPGLDTQGVGTGGGLGLGISPSRKRVFGGILDRLQRLVNRHRPQISNDFAPVLTETQHMCCQAFSVVVVQEPITPSFATPLLCKELVTLIDDDGKFEGHTLGENLYVIFSKNLKKGLQTGVGAVVRISAFQEISPLLVGLNLGVRVVLCLYAESENFSVSTNDLVRALPSSVPLLQGALPNTTPLLNEALNNEDEEVSLVDLIKRKMQLNSRVREKKKKKTQ